MIGYYVYDWLSLLTVASVMAEGRFSDGVTL